MTTVTGSTATATAIANGARYIAQLAKHWSQRFSVELDEAGATIPFEPGRRTARLQADAVCIRITLDLVEATADDVTRIKGVLATHLDRFAFREAPLAFS